MNVNNNILLILSSPSGAGKTTLTKKLQQKYKSFRISVSHTTRKPRSNEIDGVDYFFINEKEFKKKISEGAFYEYAKIFDNYYGTSKDVIKDLINNNNDILFDIDWQGTQQLSKFKELKFIKIFIIPPDKKELERRLKTRNQESKGIVDKRLSSFSEDVLHWSDYDYVVTNDNLEKCFKQIENIIFPEKISNYLS